MLTGIFSRDGLGQRRAYLIQDLTVLEGFRRHAGAPALLPSRTHRSMPRFHFNLVSAHETITDEQGVMAVDLKEAIKQAIDVIQELRDSWDLDQVSPGWKLEICDTKGFVLRSFTIV